eukprot:1190655-Prorocentrum_minimum.AAC.2
MSPWGGEGDVRGGGGAAPSTTPAAEPSTTPAAEDERAPSDQTHNEIVPPGDERRSYPSRGPAA